MWNGRSSRCIGWHWIEQLIYITTFPLESLWLRKLHIEKKWMKSDELGRAGDV